MQFSRVQSVEDIKAFRSSCDFAPFSPQLEALNATSNNALRSQRTLLGSVTVGSPSLDGFFSVYPSGFRGSPKCVIIPYYSLPVLFISSRREGFVLNKTIRSAPIGQSSSKAQFSQKKKMASRIFL